MLPQTVLRSQPCHRLQRSVIAQCLPSSWSVAKPVVPSTYCAPQCTRCVLPRPRQKGAEGQRRAPISL